MRIDFHTHVVPTDLPDFAARHGDDRWPVLVKDGRTGRLVMGGQAVRTVPGDCWSPARRIEHMDSTAVDLQVLSPLPPLMTYWSQPRPAAEFARRINASVAGVVRDWPGRFHGLATVPLQDTGRAIDVLTEASQCGLAGVEIGTRIAGRGLDDLQLRPFFAAASELGMIIFVHPLALGPVSDWTERISTTAVNFGLGMTTDTAIAASELVFGGVLAEFPELRVCLSHGGGTFVWALPRIARLWAEEGPSPTELIRNLWVDSVVYDKRNIDYLIRTLGSDRVVYGTDYPLPAADERSEFLYELAECTSSKVCGENARDLLSGRKFSAVPAYYQPGWRVNE